MTVHGPDHLGPAGFCNCGKVKCCLSESGDCLCKECACQTIRPARPVPPPPVFASFVQPPPVVPPITATHYIGEPGIITVDYCLYGETWSLPHRGRTQLGMSALAMEQSGLGAGADVEVHFTVDGFTTIERHRVAATGPAFISLEEPLGLGLARMCLGNNPPPLREETYAALRRIIPPGRAPDDPGEILREPFRHVATARSVPPEGGHGFRAWLRGIITPSAFRSAEGLPPENPERITSTDLGDGTTVELTASDHGFAELTRQILDGFELPEYEVREAEELGAAPPTLTGGDVARVYDNIARVYNESGVLAPAGIEFVVEPSALPEELQQALRDAADPGPVHNED